jgi:hypothetical protein
VAFDYLLKEIALAKKDASPNEVQLSATNYLIHSSFNNVKYM